MGTPAARVRGMALPTGDDRARVQTGFGGVRASDGARRSPHAEGTAGRCEEHREGVCVLTTHRGRRAELSLAPVWPQRSAHTPTLISSHSAAHAPRDFPGQHSPHLHPSAKPVYPARTVCTVTPGSNAAARRHTHRSSTRPPDQAPPSLRRGLELLVEFTFLAALCCFGADLFVVLLQGREVFARLEELTLLHALSDVPVHEGAL